jgi:hypothetical protein
MVFSPILAVILSSVQKARFLILSNKRANLYGSTHADPGNKKINHINNIEIFTRINEKLMK